MSHVPFAVDTIEAKSARILQLLQTLATVSSELQKELLSGEPQQLQAQQLQAQQLQAQQLQQLQAQQEQQLAQQALYQQQYEHMRQERDMQMIRDRVREEASKQRLEQQRLEQQRLEQQRLEQQRLEQQRLQLQEQEQQRLQQQQEQFELWLDQEPLLTELQYVVQQILRKEHEKAVKSGESPQKLAMILPILRSSIPRNKAHLLPAAGGRGEFKRIVEQIPNVEKVCIKANDWGYYLTRE
jgi:hypothetical protein